MTELPIACTLSAAELRERRDGLLPGLLARAVSRQPVANGYRWQFEPGEDTLSDITSVIEAERRCCRFLRFVLAAEPDEGPLWLEVTGPRGTRQFLDRLLGDATAS